MKGYRVSVSVNIEVQGQSGWGYTEPSRYKLFVIASSEEEARIKAEHWVGKLFGDWSEPYKYTDTFEAPDGTVYKEAFEATFTAAVIVNKEPYDTEWFYRSRLPGLILVE